MADVPNLPGVPPLSSGFGLQNIPLLVSDAASVIGSVLRPTWGIFLNGAPVIVTSLASALGVGAFTSAANSISSIFGGPNLIDSFSIVGFEYKKDSMIADYPVEDGGFQSYDKVQLPFDAKMRVAAGGSQSNRKALIDKAAKIADSLDLYDVVTPEKTYLSCNVSHHDYRRTAQNGVGLIVVDFWFLEVRVAAATMFTSTQNPTDSAPAGLGNVQTSSLDEVGFSGVT